MWGTDLAYGAMLCTCTALHAHGTELAYGATRSRYRAGVWYYQNTPPTPPLAMPGTGIAYAGRACDVRYGHS
eukprot:2929319-Rhodomonas_salina.1